MKKSMLIISLICILSCLSSLKAHADNVGFITRDGVHLKLNAEEFYFGAINNYYLWYKPQAMIDEIIEDAKSLGCSVMRVYGSSEGVYQQGYCFQPSPGVYDEATFQKMDYILWKASQNDIRLIIHLVNNWDEFGGIDKYVEWSPTASTHDEFFTDTWCRDYYKAYVNYFLNRVNTLTGIAYKDDPTIAILELANEPRVLSNNQTIFQAWVAEMAAYINSIDTNHLISTGAEGFGIASYGLPNYGSNFVGNNQDSNIDVCSFHHFPDPDHNNLTYPQTLSWIQDHIELAHNQVGKPVYMGEYGLQADREYTNQPTMLYNFDTSVEGWGPLFTTYNDTVTQVETPTYDGNGSIQYQPQIAFGPGQPIDGIFCGITYASPVDYSAHQYLSGWVYLPPTAPSTLFAVFFVQTGSAWAWYQGSDTYLVPGAWTKVYLPIASVGNSNETRSAGIKVMAYTDTYGGTINFDLVEGLTGQPLNYLELLARRNTYYTNWLNLFDQLNGDGAALWILYGYGDNGSSLYEDYDDYGVYYPEDMSTWPIIQDFSQNMNQESNFASNIFDPCEEIDNWVAGTTYSDAISVELNSNSQFFNQGLHSLKLNYSAPVQNKAYWEKQNLTQDWTGSTTISLDLYNPGGPTQASIVVVTEASPTQLDWYETAPVNLTNGWNSLTADLSAGNWKLNNTGEYNQFIDNLDKVRKFCVGVFGYTQAGSVYIDDIRLENLISVMPGWPKGTGGEVASSPAFGDIDGDGDLELVVGCNDNKVYAWHSDGSLVAGWPQTTNGEINSSPVLADIDGDTNLEIVVVSYDGYVYAYNGDGSLVSGWPQQVNGTLSSPAVGDVNGDGQNEIIAIALLNLPTSTEVYIWQSNGSLLNSWSISIFSGPVVNTPALADIDNDGELEIIISNYSSGAVSIYNSDGTLLPGWPQLLPSPQKARVSPAVGDLDADGLLDVVVGTGWPPNFWVYAWHSNGSIVNGWPQSIIGWVSSCPALADFDGDNHLETAIASGSYMYLFNDYGVLLPGWPQFIGGTYNFSSSAISDINNDGQLDIIIGSFNRYLYAWNKNGSLISGWPQMVAVEEMWSSPSVADFDGDGKLEAAVGSGNFVYAWNLAGASAVNALPWPMFRHDKERTGCYAPVAQQPSINITYPQEGQVVPTATPTITWTTTGLSITDNIRIMITHQNLYKNMASDSIIKKVLLAVADFFSVKPVFAQHVMPLWIEDLNVIVPNTGNFTIPAGILVPEINYTLKLIWVDDTNINDYVHFSVSPNSSATINKGLTNE